jgi:hypothetical protein
MQTRYHVFMLLVAMLVGRECMAWNPPEGYLPPRLKNANAAAKKPVCDLGLHRKPLRASLCNASKHAVIYNSTLFVLTNGLLSDMRKENEELMEENWQLRQENTELRMEAQCSVFWTKEFEDARWVTNDSNERDLMLIYLVRNFSKYLGM